MMEQIRNSDTEGVQCVRQLLARRIELYLKRSGLRPTTLGRLAARDPRLVFDIRRGREPRPTLARRLDAWLDDAERALEAKPCRPRR
jgi:hypothetical protein